jgi:S1-C subfamily serine protease
MLIYYSRLIILGTLVVSSTAVCQTIDQRDFGVIVKRDQDIGFGTGFVIQNNCVVVTCWHVAHDSHWDYIPLGTRIKLKLTLAQPFREADISVFTLDSCLSAQPLLLGRFSKIRPGDSIFYFGWQSEQSAIQIDKSVVLTTGVTLEREAVVPFLEFETVGRPGYSGGPVLNSDGKLVAIISEGWIKRSLKDSVQVLLARAFSTDTLKTFFDSFK